MVALFGSNCFSSSMKGHNELYKLVSSVASEAMGIGRTADVLTVLGGKASCRRKFVLNVHLVDDQGNLVPHDLPIVASVAYAHDHSPVVRDEKPFLAEPPLFTTFNGVEFPAQDRPTRMVSGRASFKLAISLLSSKCDNRLFCICFTPQVNTNGDGTSIYAPCYSKPIRSISRKRTQSSSHVAPAPPLLLMGGLETPQLLDNEIQDQKNVKKQQQQSQQGLAEKKKGFRGMDYLLESNEGLNVLAFGISSTVSDENDDESTLSPTRKTHLQCSSRSSSATSMQYISPTSALGSGKWTTLVEGRFKESNGRGGGRGGGAEIVLHELDASPLQSPPQAITTANIISNISSCCDVLKVRAGIDTVLETNPSRSSTSDSESPTSGGLTSESSYDNKQQQQMDPLPAAATAAATVQCSPIGTSSRLALNSASAFPHLQAPSTRPFRPYAVVGPCKLPIDTCSTNFQLGNDISLAASLSTQFVKRSTEFGRPGAAGGVGGGACGGADQNCTKTLLERMNNQPIARDGEETIPMEKLHQSVSGKMDSILHSFSFGKEMRSASNNFINHTHSTVATNNEEKMHSQTAGLTSDISLEEEEKSLQYIEVSIQEVSKEVQRRREELRSKRRRLLEDEARMHSIVFQSSSWIENLSGRFNL